MEFTDAANSKTFEKDIKIYIKMTFYLLKLEIRKM